jgi:FkbM family methyltransferase
MLPRIWRFLQKPWWEKVRSLTFRWSRLRYAAASIPFPVRLPFGAWWFARNDHIGRPIREGSFETSEMSFVDKFLRPDMTVLDIGAHHGFYTLLASKRVGPGGRVFAFEPSDRERKALIRHLRINRCRNVTVEGLAVGRENIDAPLFVVQGSQTGCNSLKKPAADVEGNLRPASVHVVRLDDWLADRKVGGVHFIKLDVEGGELDVLKGAQMLLTARPRPTVLAEVQDVRTLPWGYAAKEIIEHLRKQDFSWFRLLANGSVVKVGETSTEFEGNFVACPSESLTVMERLRA